MPAPTYNFDAAPVAPGRTLSVLRTELLSRLGFAAQAAAPPPGMATLLNSFLRSAQVTLYRRYAVLRTERYYSWALTAAQRFYDLTQNLEGYVGKLNPDKVTWAGTVIGNLWRPMRAGIPAVYYSLNTNVGRPIRYQINQALEVWPAPTVTDGWVVLRGHFGLQAFAADADPATIDDECILLLALANAKAHYRQPDAGSYTAQLEAMIMNLVAAQHGTRRYFPGECQAASDAAYVEPIPSVPFP